jgi:hypothetical protein
MIMRADAGQRRRAAQLLLVAALFAVALFAASFAQARPGGQGLSSGAGFRNGATMSSRPLGGASSDASAGLVGLLLGGFILSVSAAIRAVKAEQAYDSHDEFEADEGPIFVRRVDWAPLLARDPQFSPIVFQEFVQQLYARAHEARGDAHALASLAPYLGAEARKALATRELTGVRISHVVIGNMQILSMGCGADVTRIDLRFESNVSAEGASWYLVEDWQLVRGSHVHGKPPDQASALRCPCCRAPFEPTLDLRCKACKLVVDGGRFDWFVIGTRLRDAQWRPPALGRYVPEPTTELPTLLSPSFDEAWAALLVDDPKLDRDALFDRIRLIYERIQTAWAARELSITRPYVTDAIQDQLDYWIEAYRRQGLINCHEDAEILRIELVKLQRDAWFDALTVRIFARGLDYTIRDIDDWVVGGSATTPRHYSEYWTLIRGASVRGEARKDRACPNCEAPLAMDAQGSCEHCFSHLTRGEFDWVLSRIELDETYLG